MKISTPSFSSRFLAMRPFWPVVPAGALMFALATLVPSPRPSEAQVPGGDEYARGAQWAREVAVPAAQRPRRFIVADYVIGPGPDAQAMENSLQMLAALGINTAEIKGFGALQPRAWQRARELGINRTLRAIYSPVAAPRKGLPAPYFGWNNAALTPQALESWGRYQAQEITKLGADPGNVALFHMADEPGWYFPIISETAVDSPERMEQFRSWLRSKGLTPAELGRNSWNEVRPIGASEANDLGSRRLFYWTARYPAETASDGFKLWHNQLRRSLNQNVLVTSNWNNQVSRWYLPSPSRKFANNANAGPDAAMGMMDWMDAGRKRATGALWTQDWFKDVDAQQWSYYADALRSAAREGDGEGYRGEFGGFIIGRRLGDHPAGGRYKAMSLIGHGAKAIEWYIFGPESIFKGNSYSGNRAAYAQIAGTNRLIGRAEDLLYPGRRAPARIALLLPGSAQVWDQSPDLPLYQHELMGIHFGLTHLQYPVDFVDETGIEQGDLTSRDTNILYVTAPNVSAAAQNRIRDWVSAGGTVVFGPGAAVADEYNTPTNILNGIRGVQARAVPRFTINEGKGGGRVEFQEPTWGQSTSITRNAQPLTLTGANMVATHNGAPAMAWNRSGQGMAISYAFWAGVSYLETSQRGNPNRLPQDWDRGLLSAITAAPRVTRLPRPVEVNIPGVEASRLDSTQGTAVTLLNWTDTPQENVQVVVRNAGAVKTVGSAEGGALPFTREGNHIRVTMPIRDVDVLMIRY